MTVFSNTNSDFPDIPTGDSSVSSERYSLSISEDWSGDSIPMQLNIKSYGTVCWRNTFYIPVTIPDTDIVNDVKPSIIRIFPNPANHLLTVETLYPGLHSVEISSMNGQQILKGEMEGTSHQIDLSSFQKGVYLITIRSKDYVTTRKIIKY